jgi:hypothetical protein
LFALIQFVAAHDCRGDRESIMLKQFHDQITRVVAALESLFFLKAGILTTSFAVN